MRNAVTGGLKVLDVAIYDGDINSAVDLVIDNITRTNARQNLCISATGAHGLVTAIRNSEYKSALNSFHLNLADGTPVVWIGKWKGATNIKRGYGPDFFQELMSRSATEPITHFLCGGEEGVALELKGVCEKKYNNLKVVDTYCPPFREFSDTEMAELGQRINESGAHIVWIGLGAPKQEMFAQRLSRYTKVAFIITIGAAFDFHTGRIRQAPKWMQRSGLEWFFRLMMEPKRLYKRYFVVVPLFIYFNIKDFLHICSSKMRGK
jgi:N-acetylglucosaminyldiphosphoundecaprenol N-acetyl-beta-D-mannosaminyltransferase